jgi:hypothetical protein
MALLGMPFTTALDNGVGLTPAAGWSSWNVFAGDVTAEAVMGVADVMVEKGLDKFGYIYVGTVLLFQLSHFRPNQVYQRQERHYHRQRCFICCFSIGVYPVLGFDQGLDHGFCRIRVSIMMVEVTKARCSVSNSI